ncbi:MAG: patatin-like phospholipase family protein [Nitratireductor sp.]|nr:patatin-like phospholipase family protein [Nitratireductor sp.]
MMVPARTLMQAAHRSKAAVLLLGAVMMLGACVTASERNPYTIDELVSTTVNNSNDLRFFPQRNPDLMNALGWNPATGGTLPPAPDGRFDILALSSGGPDGAYGAGAIRGLREAGSLPEYELVTGVSTGALIAPFIFAGSQYSGFPERFYTSDLMKKALGQPNYAAALGGPALYSDRGIKPLLAREITPQLLAAIAREHARGRRLLVATANLDANTLTMWNMGAIATPGTPQALDLFRTVINAAIAIPGALPPVPIISGFSGRQFTELHGDAGVVSYFYGGPELVPAPWREKGKARLDVILHNQIEPSAKPVEARTLKLAGSSVSNLTRTSMRLLLDDTVRRAQAAGVAMRYTYLPSEWRTISSLEFDLDYMRNTFRLGQERAAGGTLWQSGPR